MPGDPSDELISNRWRELAEFAEVLIRRSGTQEEFATKPGSALAGDDRALGGYHLSTAYRMCLTASIDHLHALTTLIVDQEILHLAAPASLARGTLETAATAFWLINPKSRDERITRTLRWWSKNATDSDRATANLKSVGGQPAATVIAKLAAVATARGLDGKQATKGMTSTEVVTYAQDNATSKDGDKIPVLFPWQLCSGFAHGRPLAYMGSLNQEPLPTADPTVQNVRLTNDLSRALYPALTGLHLIESGLRAHRGRAQGGSS